MGLQPNARRVDGVAMRGEAAVALVDVGADVLDAGDDLVFVVGYLLEIAVAAVVFEDSLEVGGVTVGTVRAVFFIHNSLNSVGHALAIGRTHARDVWRKANGVG